MTSLGLVTHTGWTWLVRVGGTARSPVVEARARVVACDVLDAELYHRAAERERDPAGFVERGRAAAVTQACAAIASHVRGVGAAIVVGKRAVLLPLPRIIAAHPLIHGAEGELWRVVFAEAIAAAGVAVSRADAGQIRAAIARRFKPARVAEFLAAGKQAVGAPWTREAQDAALAAWSVLAG